MGKNDKKDALDQVAFGTSNRVIVAILCLGTLGGFLFMAYAFLESSFR